MGIFSKKKIEPELALVFDVGSSSIGGAFFEINKPGVPRIIFSIRESIILEEKVDFDRFLFLALKSLELVVSKICLAGFPRPSKIFCVLSSPWYASQTRVIKLEKNAPFVFTSKLADDLIKKEISLFEEENLNRFSDSNKVRPIEFKNMKTILNGYATSDPFEKKAKRLEMVIFISMSEDKILTKMEEIISKHFHREDVQFSSFAMNSFTVARDMFVAEDSFLLVDISGETTDVSIIKRDILSNSISYPLGYNFMIRKVAEGLNVPLSEAKSLMSLYKDGHALKSSLKKLEPIMNDLKKEWLKRFQESLFNISEDISVPSTIFVAVDQGIDSFFSEIIKNEQFNQYALIDLKFKIVFLSTETLHDVTNFKDDVLRDPFIMIESVYINRFLC